MERHPVPIENGESVISLKQSIAELFEENKNTAGFENPGKSLYTTVTKLVENALDSAESIEEFLRIEVKIEEIGRSENNSMTGRTVKDSEKVKKRKKGPSIYRVTCKDNGGGMTFKEIVDMFGPVRTKCRVKQTREKSTLGARMALIWAKKSTGRAVAITTSMKGQDYQKCCHLDIDIDGNFLKIQECTRLYLDGDESWHGTEIRVEVEGNWETYGSEIMEYMRHMAVITGHAEFTFQYVPATPNQSTRKVSYPRMSEELPPLAVERRYHPSAVDLPIICGLIHQNQNHNLLDFLHCEFSDISVNQAERLIGEMGPGVTSKTQVSSLTIQQTLEMFQLLREAKRFDPPGGDCLSPVGKENLGDGIAERLLPDMLTSHSETSARVYQGHPFIVEAAVSLGGSYFKKGVNIFRFANRVPLLFRQDADAITTATKRINWGLYGIKVKKDRIGVFVSIVSTKIPFGAGLECIGDDTITDAVHAVLEEICKDLKAQLDEDEEQDGGFKTRFISRIPVLANIAYNLRNEKDTHITEESLRLGLQKLADQMDDS